MFQYGSEGWIHYDFEVKNKRAKFNVSLHPIKLAQDGISFQDACDQVANELYNTYGKLCVAMSGGIDSEHLANVLYRNQIPFTPVIFTVEDLNELDVWWAFDWCREHNIKPHVINYNVSRFSKELITQSEKYGIRNFPGPFAIDLAGQYADSIGAKLISGSGNHTHWPDLVLAQMQVNDSASYSYNDYRLKEVGYYAHLPEVISHQLNPNHPFSFYNWNPQIMYSYIYEYDISSSSEVNKARLMCCPKRPKNVGYPDYFWRTHPPLVLANHKRKLNREPHTEVDYLGTREEILNLLKIGSKHV